jgi:hypothetical protein
MGGVVFDCWLDALTLDSLTHRFKCSTLTLPCLLGLPTQQHNDTDRLRRLPHIHYYTERRVQYHDLHTYIHTYVHTPPSARTRRVPTAWIRTIQATSDYTLLIE